MLAVSNIASGVRSFCQCKGAVRLGGMGQMTGFACNSMYFSVH